jgi:lysophospholipase L1-like esterase
MSVTMGTNQSYFYRVLLIAAVAWLCAAISTAAESIRIMPLGDSITAGYTDNPTWNVPFGFGYRSGLYTRLTDANCPFQYVGGSQEPWNGAFGVPKTVASPDLRTVSEDFHRGYGGVDATFLSSNIGNWLSSDVPDVVLLMIGINSISQGGTANPTTAENNLSALVQSIVYQRPTARVIVAQITPYATYTSSIVQYNSYIKDTLVPHFAALGKNVTTVDQYSNFGTGTTVDSSLYSNGINHPNAAGYDKMARTWFAGIQALGAMEHTAGPAQSSLANGSFESPQYSNNTHNINPAGTGWAFTPSSVGAGSGIDHGNPYGASAATNCTPASGTQMAFLQGAGAGNGVCSISQNMTGLIVGRTYNLSFSAKGIKGFSGINPFSVSIDSSTVDFGGGTVLSPAATTNYTSYNTTFMATSPTMPLRFFDRGNVAVGQVTWIDSVKLGLATPAAANLVTNGTFEANGFGDNTHNVNPSGTGWRFTAGGTAAGSGIDRGNPYGVANASAYEGSQYAFLQGRGEGNGATGIEQDVSGFQPGQSYVLTFESAAIEGASGANPFFASVGGNTVTFGDSAYVSPSASYGLYTSTPFTATSGTMTFRFFDAGNVPVTFASWIDDVQITAVPEPSSKASMIGVVIVLAIGAVVRRVNRTGRAFA